MNNEVINAPYLTTKQQRLLGGWLDILDDIRHLCRSLRALPESCRCGNGSAHLSGSCPCCHATPSERLPDCEDCDILLACLRPDIDTLIVDTARFFPTFRDVIHADCPDPTLAEAGAIEQHIAAVAWTFRQLIFATDDFRAGCRASHLGTIKERAANLLGEVTDLDRRLRGRDDHV